MPKIQSLHEEVESLQNLLVSHATGGAENEAEYSRLRQLVLAEPSIELTEILVSFGSSSRINTAHTLRGDNTYGRNSSLYLIYWKRKEKHLLIMLSLLPSKSLTTHIFMLHGPKHWIVAHQIQRVLSPSPEHFLNPFASISLKKRGKPMTIAQISLNCISKRQSA